MPRRNRKLENFFHVFKYEEAEELVTRFNRHGFHRNMKDTAILSNVCEEIATEYRNTTGDPRWSEENVKMFIANNVRLFPLFVDYVNKTIGVQYNATKNRITVGVEYWHFTKKETENQKLFRECGYPFYDTWSIILSYHRPAEVIMDPVGSSPSSPIVVRDEPFDPEATDLIDVQFPRTRRSMSVIPSKLRLL